MSAYTVVSRKLPISVGSILGEAQPGCQYSMSAPIVQAGFVPSEAGALGTCQGPYVRGRFTMSWPNARPAEEGPSRTGHR